MSDNKQVSAADVNAQGLRRIKLASLTPSTSAALTQARTAERIDPNGALLRTIADATRHDGGAFAAVFRSGMPDYTKITAGFSAFDGIVPDYGKVIAGLSVFDSIVPDYGKVIGGLAGLNSSMPDYTKIVGGLAGLKSSMPDYTKALAGLSAIDAFAFEPQHALLEAAAGFSQHASLAAQAAQILSSQDSIAQLIATTIGGAARTDLYNTLGQFSLVQAHLGSFAVKPEPAAMLRGSTRLTSRHYDAYLDGLPPRPITRRADVARFAGSTQSGLLVAESLTSAGLRGDDREELTEHLAAVVGLQPWQTGPAEAREDLFAALAEVDAELPGWLQAAWEDIVRDSLKMASKVANCTIECIDRTLRVIAPVKDVSEWIASVGPKRGWLGEDNRPTRRAKIMFVMRNRSDRDARLAAAQAEALVSLVQEVVGALQDSKHGEGPTRTIMRSLVMATEGALAQLLLQDEAGRLRQHYTNAE